MKKSNSPKFIFNLFSLFLFIGLFNFTACSSDDDAAPVETIDIRYKVVFDGASGSIIGDTSNEVLNQFSFASSPTSGSISFISSYFQLPNSNRMEFVGRNNLGDMKLYSMNLDQLLESNVSIEVSEIHLFTPEPNERIIISGFRNPNNPFILVTDENNESRIIYKEYLGSDLIDTRDFSKDYLVSATFNGGFAYFKDQGLIVILQEDFNVSTETINAININDWSLTKYEGAFNSTLFGYFSNANEAYLIGRNSSNGSPTESLYNIDGSLVTQVDDIISRNTAIGFNNEKNQFEFLTRADFRRQTGRLDTSNGTLEGTFFSGESGFVSSPLFFFNKN